MELTIKYEFVSTEPFLIASLVLLLHFVIASLYSTTSFYCGASYPICTDCFFGQDFHIIDITGANAQLSLAVVQHKYASRAGGYVCM